MLQTEKAAAQPNSGRGVVNKDILSPLSSCLLYSEKP